MLRQAAIALAFGLAGATGAIAQSASNDYQITQFEAREVSVATATDTKSGRKFNIVKLPNGKMMALISMNKVNALSPYADDSEMMYSGHTGTSR